MKETTLLQMKNQLNNLTQTMEAVKQELYNLRVMSVGSMQLIEKFDGYEAALDLLKIDMAEAEKENEPKLED